MTEVRHAHQEPHLHGGGVEGTAYRVPSEDETREGAAYVLARHGSAMVPYLCDRCHCWHLSPYDRQTRASTCTACVGRDGRPKARYDSKEAAAHRLEILRRERHVSLRVYQCPYGGWHLTKA